jgi:membrane associated rhomboid family serine protease
MFPNLIIAGSSLGIYAVLGALSLKGSNFFKRKYLLILIFPIIIFAKDIFDLYSCPECISIEQTGFHLAGFAVGILLLYIIIKVARRKKSILSLSRQLPRRTSRLRPIRKKRRILTKE